MPRVYNFSAGPGTLPEEVLLQAADEMLDWRGSASPMEMSHRGKDFVSIAEEAEADLRKLLAVRWLPRALPAGRGVAAVRDDPDEPDPGPGRR